MTVTRLIEKYIAAFAIAAAVCFAFFAVNTAAVHAEEDGETDSAEETTEEDADDEADAEMREAMKAQIESLKATIEARKAEIAAKRDAMKEEKKAERESMKADFQADKADFAASLEGLSEEEKKAAMKEYIEEIKAQIEARKAAMKAEMEEKKAEHEVNKEARIQDREEFRASLEDMTPQERMEAIMERIANIQAEIESRGDEDESDDVDPEVAGISVDLISSSETFVTGSDIDSSDDSAEFSLEFYVTAIEGDISIAETADRGSDTEAGMSFVIENGFGEVVTDGTVTASLSLVAGGDAGNGFITVDEGETATVALEVTFDPTETDQYRVQPTQMMFSAGGEDESLSFELTPDYDFESGMQLITS